MHECGECGQACDCDGEDTWFDDLQTYLNCSHECEEFDDDEDDLSPDFQYDMLDEGVKARAAQQRNEAETGRGLVDYRARKCPHCERMIGLDGRNRFKHHGPRVSPCLGSGEVYVEAA
jgi:hypothetical protein